MGRWPVSGMVARGMPTGGMPTGGTPWGGTAVTFDRTPAGEM